MADTLTFVLMDPPFETERSTTAFRMIDAALRKGANVNVFAYEGAVYLPFAKQKAHANAIHGTTVEDEQHPLSHEWVESLKAWSDKHGQKFRWINCGLCEDERGAHDSVEFVEKGTPKDLLSFIESSDTTIVIPTR